MTAQPLYKVIVNGRSCHGGDSKYPLPAQGKPGRWTRTIQDVSVCESGYHLTTDPMRWARVGMQVFAAEGRGASETDADKTAFASVRLIREAPETIPAYWRKVEAFIAELANYPWLQPQGEPDPAWRVFDTWAAAWTAAGTAAGDAAWDAAWAAAGNAAGDAAWAAAGAAIRAAAGDAAGDAVLWARVLACDGLPLDQRHIDHARARMDVWQRGYGLYGDVDGVLYVYRRTA